MEILNEYNKSIGKSIKESSADSVEQITPREIIEFFHPLKELKWSSVNLSDKYYYSVGCYAQTAKRIAQYSEQRCVIAYMKNSLGSVFIIKGAKKHFAFTVKHPILNGHPNLIEFSVSSAIEFLDSSSETQILNQTEYDKVKKVILAENLVK